MRYECDVCGHRFEAETSIPACKQCGRPPETLEQIADLPEDSIRIYCTKCDFETTIHREDAYFPRRLAEGRAAIHSSQRGHPTKFEQSKKFSDERDGDARRICGKLDSEEELQTWLESYFEENGWVAIREVSPANSSVRADLIVKHDEYGWIGIETKYFENDGGAKVAQAHHQISRKYRGKKYIGNRINLWAFCPYFHGMNREGIGFKPNQQRLRAEFSREMFCKHGVGYIGLNTPDLLIDFAYSMPIAKIPVNGDEESRYYENVDIEKIRQSVKRKMEEYDYRD